MQAVEESHTKTEEATSDRFLLSDLHTVEKVVNPIVTHSLSPKAEDALAEVEFLESYNKLNSHYEPGVPTNNRTHACRENFHYRPHGR